MTPRRNPSNPWTDRHRHSGHLSRQLCRLFCVSVLWTRHTRPSPHGGPHDQHCHQVGLVSVCECVLVVIVVVWLCSSLSLFCSNLFTNYLSPQLCCHTQLSLGCLLHCRLCMLALYPQITSPTPPAPPSPKMLVKEYRIPLPLTVDEYKIAQLYMIAVSGDSNSFLSCILLIGLFMLTPNNNNNNKEKKPKRIGRQWQRRGDIAKRTIR